MYSKESDDYKGWKRCAERKKQIKRIFFGQAEVQLSGDGLFVSKLSPTTDSLNNRFLRFDNPFSARYSGELSKDTPTKIDFTPIIYFKLLLCQGNNMNFLF
jgi:hypothetical protein